jgi:hypothetical protein
MAVPQMARLGWRHILKQNLENLRRNHYAPIRSVFP